MRRPLPGGGCPVLLAVRSTPWRCLGCAQCDAELAAGARFCSSCGSARDDRATRAGRAPRLSLTAGHQRALRRPGRLHHAVGVARPGGGPRAAVGATSRSAAAIVDRYGGDRREVHRRRGDGGVGRADRPRGRRRAGGPRRARAGRPASLRSAPTSACPTWPCGSGIVTGEVAVTVGAEQQGMVAGDAVNTASRVQSAAAPGQVWVDETTRLLTVVGDHLRRRRQPRAEGQGRPGAAVGGARGRRRRRRWPARRRPRGAARRPRPRAAAGQGALPRRRGVRPPRCSSSTASPGVGKTRLGWEFEKYTDGLHASRALAQRPLPGLRRGRRLLRARRGGPRPAPPLAWRRGRRRSDG